MDNILHFCRPRGVLGEYFLNTWGVLFEYFRIATKRRMPPGTTFQCCAALGEYLGSTLRVLGEYFVNSFTLRPNEGGRRAQNLRAVPPSGSTWGVLFEYLGVLFECFEIGTKRRRTPRTTS